MDLFQKVDNYKVITNEELMFYKKMNADLSELDKNIVSLSSQIDENREIKLLVPYSDLFNSIAYGNTGKIKSFLLTFLEIKNKEESIFSVKNTNASVQQVYIKVVQFDEKNNIGIEVYDFTKLDKLYTLKFNKK